MTHACCPACRLRTRASAAGPEPCPTCGEPLTVALAADVFGLPLVDLEPVAADAVSHRVPRDLL